MDINDITRWLCLISLAIGSAGLTIALSGSTAMLLGIFFLGFAVMTAIRYPYHD